MNQNTTFMRTTIKKAYVVHLSNKQSIKIDEDELQNVIDAIRTKSIVKVRQAIFNPAFFVSITVDEERISEIIDDNIRNAHQIGTGERQQRQLEKLGDIFETVKLIDSPTRKRT